MMRIFEPKRENATNRTKMQRFIIHSPRLLRMIKSWAEHVVRVGEIKHEYKILVGIHEEKRQLGLPRHR
jgi:hypothetical protein